MKSSNTFEQKIELSMHIFMYELEKSLNNFSHIIANLKYQEDEANTDKELKSFLKTFINNNFANSFFFKNNLQLKIIIDHNENEFSRNFFSDVYISEAYTADQLTEEQKEYFRTKKNGVYTNPDLVLGIGDSTGISYISIEIKSTKKNVIPGSSIQQVHPDEWVVFIKRSNGDAKVATGKYIDLFIPKLNFPDRSPRPQISFDNLAKHNQKNRTLIDNTLTFLIDKNETENKKDILIDWQNNLSKDWFNVVTSKEKKKKESWFTRPLRLFALRYLNYYDGLTEKEKEIHKQHLKNNTI